MSEHPPQGRKRFRLARVLRIVAIVSIGLIVVIPFGLGFAFMAALTVTGCEGEIDPAGYGMAREDVSFPSSEFDSDYAGYFIPGTNGATVIVVPTQRAGRGDRMSEIAILHDGGYNVLTYSARTCFGALFTLGYAEVTAVGDALAYLQTREDVDVSRIAIHGFSAGGATTLMAFGRYPTLRAAVASGGYHDFDALLDGEVVQMGVLRGLYDVGVRLAYRLSTGDDTTLLSPINGVRESDPRPILLVYGSNENSLDGARRMQAVAPERVRLWIVPGAGHGNYVDAAGAETYRQEVVGFLDEVMGE